MTKPLIQKVDCIRLYVTSLESGLAFYRDQLGLALIWRTEQAAGLRMPNDETEIVLHTERQGPEIDLQVACADDAAVQIEEAGGKVIAPPFDIQIGRCVVVRDPWENELVLLDTTKGLLETDADGNVIGDAVQSSSGDTDDQGLIILRQRGQPGLPPARAEPQNSARLERYWYGQRPVTS
jgi:lactoylglutathione lyase